MTHPVENLICKCKGHPHWWELTEQLIIVLVSKINDYDDDDDNPVIRQT